MESAKFTFTALRSLPPPDTRSPNRCTIGDGVSRPTMPHPLHHHQDLPITNRRFFLLFVFLLATLILYPYAEATHFASYAFRVIGSFAIVASVYAAKIHRGVLVLAIFLAIPALFERIAFPKSTPTHFSFSTFRCRSCLMS
jgi:hypothetical protein